MNIQIQYIECPIQYSAFEFAYDSADSPSPAAPVRAESEAATPSQTEDSAENKPIPQSLTAFQSNPHTPYSRNHSIKVLVIKRAVHMGNERDIDLLMKHCIPVETRKKRMTFNPLSFMIHASKSLTRPIHWSRDAVKDLALKDEESATEHPLKRREFEALLQHS